MITYSTLISHVRPFFMSRGGDELSGNERMLFYANCAIQDCYNLDNATFTYETEFIEGIVNGSKIEYTTQFNIRKIQQCIGYYKDGRTIEMTPTLFLSDDDCALKYQTGSNKIVTNSRIIKIEVVYVKEYKWAGIEDLKEVIQVPERYVPAICKLMYDWASPVNLMSGETAQVDFFSHAMTRLKQLSDDDSLTDLYRLSTDR